MKNLVILLIAVFGMHSGVFAQPQADFELERDSLDIIKSSLMAELTAINTRLDYLNQEIIRLKIDSIRVKGIVAYLKEPAVAWDRPSDKNVDKILDFEEGEKVWVHGAKRQYLMVNLDGIAGYIHSRHFLKTDEINFLLEVAGIEEEPPIKDSIVPEKGIIPAPAGVQIQKDDATRCIAKTQDGTRCKNKTTNLSGRCHVHN